MRTRTPGPLGVEVDPEAWGRLKTGASLESVRWRYRILGFLLGIVTTNVVQGIVIYAFSAARGGFSRRRFLDQLLRVCA